MQAAGAAARRRRAPGAPSAPLVLVLDAGGGCAGDLFAQLVVDAAAHDAACAGTIPPPRLVLIGAGRGPARFTPAAAAAVATPPATVDANATPDAAAFVAAVDAAAAVGPCRVAVDSMTALCLLFNPFDALHAVLDVARLPCVVSVIVLAAECAIPAAVASAVSDAASAIVAARAPARASRGAGADVVVETSLPKSTGRVDVSSDGAARSAGGRLSRVDPPKPPPPPPPPAAPTVGTMRMSLTPAEAAARAAVVLPHEAEGWRGGGGGRDAGPAAGGGPVVRYDRDSDSASLADSGEDPDDALDV